MTITTASVIVQRCYVLRNVKRNSCLAQSTFSPTPPPFISDQNKGFEIYRLVDEATDRIVRQSIVVVVYIVRTMLYILIVIALKKHSYLQCEQKIFNDIIINEGFYETRRPLSIIFTWNLEIIWVFPSYACEVLPEHR